MPKVGLAILHGMGSQKEGFSDDFIDKTRSRFIQII